MLKNALVMVWCMVVSFGLECASTQGMLSEVNGTNALQNIAAPDRVAADACVKEWMAMAEDAYDQRNYSLVIELCTEMAFSVPGDSRAYAYSMSSLGRSYLRTQNVVSSIDCFERALPLMREDDWHVTLRRLGKAYEMFGDVSRAVACYKRGHKAHPGALIPALHLLYLGTQTYQGVRAVDQETLELCTERLLRLIQGYEYGRDLYEFRHEFPHRLPVAYAHAEEIAGKPKGFIDSILFPAQEPGPDSVHDIVFDPKNLPAESK